MGNLPKQVEEAGKVADELLEKQANPEPEVKADLEPEVKDPVVEDPKVKEPTEAEKLQAKLDTLRGKYNAEVKETRTTNQFLTEEILRLKTEAEAKPKEPEPPQKLDLSKYLTPEQMALMDDEMDPAVKEVIADLVQGVTKSNIPQTADLEAKVTTLEQGQAATSWEVFLGRVEKAFPGYESTINTDPKFVAYMAETIPGTGYTRQAIMDSAAQRLDSAAVVEMYADFTKQAPAADPSPKKDLKSQIDPVDNLAVKGDQLISASDKMYTVKDVNAHYKEMALGEASDYKKGKYANNPELAKSVDAAILAANAEGRITR